MKNKDEIDCLKMKDEVQKKLYEITKNMTDEELISFYNKSKKKKIKKKKAA